MHRGCLKRVSQQIVDSQVLHDLIKYSDRLALSSGIAEMAI